MDGFFNNQLSQGGGGGGGGVGGVVYSLGVSFHVLVGV